MTDDKKDKESPSALRYTVGTPEENDALHVLESVFAFIEAILPLIPLQVDQRDIQSMRQFESVQQGLNRMGMLLVEMNSRLVTPVENPGSSGSSGLIIPR